MKLHGTIIDNLQAALASAKRLRGQSVHRDTISFWRDVIEQARLETPEQTHKAEIETLITALEAEIADEQSS
jgi:glycine cleavage system protein P-like pyridoxal-binding family